MSSRVLISSRLCNDVPGLLHLRAGVEVHLQRWCPLRCYVGSEEGVPRSTFCRHLVVATESETPPKLAEFQGVQFGKHQMHSCAHASRMEARELGGLKVRQSQQEVNLEKKLDEKIENKQRIHCTSMGIVLIIQKLVYEEAGNPTHA